MDTEFHRIAAPAALCLRRGQQAEGRGAGRRAGHHRFRHGQSRPAAARAMSRPSWSRPCRTRGSIAIPTRAASRAAPGAGRPITRGASASSSIPSARRSSPSAPRRASPISPRPSPARATSSWRPIPAIPSMPSASSSPGRRSAPSPSSPARRFLDAIDRAVRHSVPKPLAVVVNYPSNPDGGGRHPRFLRRDRRLLPPSRHLRHLRHRLCRGLFRRPAAALDPAGARCQGDRRRVQLAQQDLLDAGLAHRLLRRQSSG